MDFRNSNPDIKPALLIQRITRRATVALENGHLKLPKAGYVKVKQHRAIPEDYRIKSVTISQNPGGDYYASVLFEYENQVQKQPMHQFLGLDFSMQELYRDSEGREPEYPGYYRKAEQKLKREQRKLSKNAERFQKPWKAADPGCQNA
mgnify:CR=1 FL=1